MNHNSHSSTYNNSCEKEDFEVHLYIPSILTNECVWTIAVIVKVFITNWSFCCWTIGWN